MTEAAMKSVRPADDHPSQELTNGWE